MRLNLGLNLGVQGGSGSLPGELKGRNADIILNVTGDLAGIPRELISDGAININSSADLEVLKTLVGTGAISINSTADLEIEPTLWTPAELGSSLALWLDADDASTITLQGGGGSGPGGSDHVSQWDDKSGNGNHVSQSVASAQPAYTLNNLNNKPGITSTGSRILESLSNIAWNFDIGSFATVCNFASADNYEMLFQLTSPTEGGSTDYLFFRRNQLLNTIDFNSSSLGLGELSSDAAVYTGRYERNIARNTSVNGAVFIGPSSGSFTGQVSSARFSVLGPSFSFAGSLNEIILCKNYLPDADRQKLEGYLAWKWGGI